MKKHLKIWLSILILAGMLLPATALGACNHPSVSRSYYVGQEATCTEYGIKYECCLFCGWVDYGNPIRIEKAPHTFKTQTVTKEATCSEPGIITYTCSVCGYKKNEEIPKTNNHQYGDWVTSEGATCTDAGTRTRTCTLCGHQETETVKAGSNHTYGEWKVTKEATCTESGTRTRTCTRCGHTETEKIAAGNHKYGDWKVTQEATCTKNGSRTRTCTVCGRTETETIKSGGGNHKFGEWTVNKEPTCTRKGQEMRRCKLCGELQYKTLPKSGHTSDNWNVTKEATCKQEGKRTGTCSVCGKKVTETIPKTDHDYEKWVIEVPETDCSKGRRSSKCKNCGKKITEEYYPEGTLYKGGDNPQDEVEALQEALAALGFFNGKITGEYDNATASAVSKFEKSVGMKADGICWPKVKRLLGIGRGAGDPISANPTQIKLKLEAAVVSAEKKAYRAGDQISIQWTLTNESKKYSASEIHAYRFRGKKADVNKDLDIGQKEELATGESYTDTYTYTVTEEDVQASRFTVGLIVRCKVNKKKASTNTVTFIFTGTAGAEDGTGENGGEGGDGTDSGNGVDTAWTPPDAGAEEGTGDESQQPGRDPVIPDGTGCGITLIAEGEGRAEYELTVCGEHAKLTADTRSLMESGNYDEADRILDEAVGSLYQQWIGHTEGEAKEHAEEEQAAFAGQITALQASVRLLCEEKEAREIAVEERMNHCANMCYELHTGAETRTDSIMGSHTVYSEAGDGSRCRRETFWLSNSVHVAHDQCRTHLEVMNTTRQLLQDAGEEGAAAAWQQAQQNWMQELNALYDAWYLAAEGNEEREKIVADRTAFGQLIEARKKTLADRYPDNPAATAEVLANMIMNRTELICSLLRSAGIPIKTAE